MPSPLCLLRTIWRSLICGKYVSGHDFEIECESPDNVLVLRCRDCGALSIGWGWGSQKKGEAR